MKAGDLLGRYRLTDLITSDAGQSVTGDVGDVLLWRAYDTVLDRDVAIRVLDASDIRVPAVVGAAQASARIDDRHLLRVLDVLEVPARDDDPAVIAVVTEWASGRNLERTIQERGGSPFVPGAALALVSDVARILAAAQKGSVAHGRLRPSSVFITDAGDVRLRGLAVDAALFGIQDATDGSSPTDPFASDVDALGALLYLLVTGMWPGPTPAALSPAPRSGTMALPPSSVRASVPSGVDDLVARSMLAAPRPKGVARLADAGAFSLAASTSLDYIAPVSTTVHPVARTGWRRAAHGAAVVAGRVLIVVVALALVGALAWAGWQMVTATSIAPKEQANAALEEMLTSEAHAIEDTAAQAIEQVRPIAAMRSFDPFGDDNANDKPDKRKGREGEDTVATVNDIDPETAWLTDEYADATLDGKGGTGLILDLGTAQDIRQVSMKLVNPGGDVEVKVANRILSDPALWTPIAAVPNAPATINVRTPRPVNARYVLIWLPSVPPAPEAGYGVYQGGVATVEVSG